MLEQTYSCNLKCPSCIHGFPEDKKKFNSDTKVMPRDLFEQIINLDEKNSSAISGLIRVFIGLNKLKAADKFINTLNKEVMETVEVKEAISSLKLMQNSSVDTNVLNDLEKNYLKQPNNLQANYDLAIALFGCKNTEKAINLLLDSISINPSWNEGKARKKLLEFFSAIGHSDPKVIESRKKLSSLIFK